MRRLRTCSGVTLIELLLVLVIGGIMSMVAIRSFSQVHGSLGARTAQSTFTGMHAQARAISVEHGIPVLLRVDPESGAVSIQDLSGEVLRSRDFAASYDVTIGTPNGVVDLCMVPRGFADPRCGNVNDRTEITFTRGNRVRSVTLLPLGQLVEA